MRWGTLPSKKVVPGIVPLVEVKLDKMCGFRWGLLRRRLNRDFFTGATIFNYIGVTVPRKGVWDGTVEVSQKSREKMNFPFELLTQTVYRILIQDTSNNTDIVQRSQVKTKFVRKIYEKKFFFFVIFILKVLKNTVKNRSYIWKKKIRETQVYFINVQIVSAVCL